MISGPETTQQAYEQITAGDKEGEDAPRGELQSLEQQVINFFNNKVIPFDSKIIAPCHTMPMLVMLLFCFVVKFEAKYSL